MLLIRKDGKNFFGGGSPTGSSDLILVRDQAAMFVLGSSNSVELDHDGLQSFIILWLRVILLV
jgi:hypothetical protein